MWEEENRSVRPVSRRDFINIVAVSGGALLAASHSSAALSAPDKKYSQKQAHYQPIPKSGQRCQTCALWQPPTACEQVEGQISPAGWCMLYVQKG